MLKGLLAEECTDSLYGKPQKSKGIEPAGNGHIPRQVMLFQSVKDKVAKRRTGVTNLSIQHINNLQVNSQQGFHESLKVIMIYHDVGS